MALWQEGEEQRRFSDDQSRILDSAGNHLKKACIAGMLTGVASAITPVGSVVGLEMVHQLIAASVDLGKHESNRRKHSKETSVT